MKDFHAHILPGADHGSNGLETSLCQLELAEAAGIDTIVATPHYYPQSDDFTQVLKKREVCYSLLMNNYHGPIRILPAAEVRMCTGIDHLKGVRELCIPGTDIMLCELPFHGYGSGLDETFLRLQDDLQIEPILVHVDRYDPKLIEKLSEMGLRGQVNADAVCHHMGRRRLFSWIDEQTVVALGSDIHGVQIGYSHYTKAMTILDRRGRMLQNSMTALLEPSEEAEPEEENRI